MTDTQATQVECKTVCTCTQDFQLPGFSAVFGDEDADTSFGAPNPKFWGSLLSHTGEKHMLPISGSDKDDEFNVVFVGRSPECDVVVAADKRIRFSSFLCTHISVFHFGRTAESIFGFIALHQGRPKPR